MGADKNDLALGVGESWVGEGATGLEAPDHDAQGDRDGARDPAVAPQIIGAAGIDEQVAAGLGR